MPCRSIDMDTGRPSREPRTCSRGNGGGRGPSSMISLAVGKEFLLFLPSCLALICLTTAEEKEATQHTPALCPAAHCPLAAAALDQTR